MEIRQLATFRAVARALSFSRAAASLHYAQSTVSAQVQTLEEELGVSLFDRLGRRVALTDAGQRLLPYADRILSLSTEARSEVSGSHTPAGTLTVSAGETLCTYRLPPVLREYRRRFPRVQLVLGPQVAGQLRQQLGEGRMDVVLELRRPFEAPGLTVEPLTEEPLRLVAPPRHPLASARRVRLRDLQDEPLLLTEPGCTYRRLFEDALTEAGVRVTGAMEFHSVEAIKQCTMAGVGIAMLPTVAVAREVRLGRLKALRCPELRLSVSTCLVWHRDKWLSAAARAFIDLCREMLPGTASARRRAG